MATPMAIPTKRDKEVKRSVKDNFNIVDLITAEIKPLDPNHKVQYVKNVFDNFWRINFFNADTGRDLTSVFLAVNDIDGKKTLKIIEDGRRNFFNNPMIKSAIKF